VTLHADALIGLEQWRPPTMEQAGHRARFVEHLRRHRNALSRDCYPDHLTASTLVMTPDASQALLTLHAKAATWFQFGGHCERGDRTLLEAARREATEESGIDRLTFDPVPLCLAEHAVPFCDPRRGARHLDVWFLATADPAATPTVSTESLDVRWWRVDELPPHEWADPIALARRRLGSSASRN
jgi:8-oxo-dGTP pyrophosphatase MutT (NUDIX family)